MSASRSRSILLLLLAVIGSVAGSSIEVIWPTPTDTQHSGEVSLEYKVTSPPEGAQIRIHLNGQYMGSQPVKDGLINAGTCTLTHDRTPLYAHACAHACAVRTCAHGFINAVPLDLSPSRYEVVLDLAAANELSTGVHERVLLNVLHPAHEFAREGTAAQDIVQQQTCAYLLQHIKHDEPGTRRRHTIASLRCLCIWVGRPKNKQIKPTQAPSTTANSPSPSAAAAASPARSVHGLF